MSKSNGARIDRRTFLKGSAVLGAGAGIAGMFSGCAAAGGSGQGSTDGGAAQPSGKARFRPWEVAPDPIPGSEITETIEADVVVVGAGIAGVNAAWAAAEAGAEVIVLEQMDTWSGRGWEAAALNTKTQKEHGVTIDPSEAVRHHMLFSGEKVSRELVSVWANRSGEVFDEIIDRFAQEGHTTVLSTRATPESALTPFPNAEFQTAHRFGDEGYNAPDGRQIMTRAVECMEKWATQAGADFRYSTKAEQLVRADGGKGRIVSVVATDPSGAYVEFAARNGVILATGDASGDDDMVEALTDFALRCQTRDYYPLGANKGDGLKMGIWAGGAPQKATPAQMKQHTAVDDMILDIEGLYWLMVNNKGNRFMNEAENFGIQCNAYLMQPKGEVWMICDSLYKEKSEITMPGAYPDDVDEKLAKVVASGEVLKADTIEELADMIGAPRENLVATVEERNRAAAEGVDPEYGTPAKYLVSIDTPPYYASPVESCFELLLYGLNVDSNSQVCDSDDVPIEGLYAIGNVQGNFFANDYSFSLPGISHGRAITFGHLVGKALAQGKNLDEL